MSSKCYAENKMAILNLRLNCEDKISPGKILQVQRRTEKRHGEVRGRELGDEVGEGSLEYLMEGLWGGLLNVKGVWPFKSRGSHWRVLSAE